MINIFAISTDSEILKIDRTEDLNSENIKWYWLDMCNPSDDEVLILKDFFNFHQLAIEDCMHYLQRAKLDKYDKYNFFVVHGIDKSTLSANEVDLFINDRFIVSFHKMPLNEIDEVFDKLNSSNKYWQDGPLTVQYLILDKLVDNYFPLAYEIEDYLDDFDASIEINKDKSSKLMINRVYEVRSKLLKMRRIINQMRDLLYRIISSEAILKDTHKHAYFADIYDHLLRLSEIIESSLLITSDLRDSYMSITSDKMNRIMMLFTAITTIFVPVTFIAGVYGMNFQNMPELNWRYSYFVVLGIMIGLMIFMFIWFKKKGWFDI